MKLRWTNLPLAWLLLRLVFAQAPQNGVVGFPANPYDPFCATACLRSFTSLMLSCSSDSGSMLGMMAMMTPTECYASNTPFLTSVAWCMQDKCAPFNLEFSEMEFFWQTQVTGQQSAGVRTVPPKWSYQQSLQHINGTPTLQLSAMDMDLNTTSLVSPAIYLGQWNALTTTQQEGTTENGYGIVMLVTGFGLPIILTWLSYVPFVSSALRRLKPYLSWPSSIGTYHIRPLPYLLGNAPTVGQSLYIALFVILNILFTAINYQPKWPHPWYQSPWAESVALVFARTGVFAYIIAPLLFLFAGRNNILLWLTNWSHSTFILLHRWVARVFALQALLHSVLALVLYVQEGTYATNSQEPYWIWGIVATVCTVALLLTSVLCMRRTFYEAFLVIHIVLSVIVIVGIWYHAYDLYAYLGAYEDWIYAIAAVWGFDRLARLVRIAIAGPRRAVVTEIGTEYVRLDIKGIRWGTDPGKHVYVYLPTLHPLRPWENHPFSVMPTVLLHPSGLRQSVASWNLEQKSPGSDILELQTPSSKDGSRERIDIEKRPRASPGDHANGLTLLVRKSKGITRALQTHKSLLTFLEGPYPNNSTTEVLRCDRLLLIGGGIGITALIPFALNHWNVKLCWSVRESASCLVDELQTVLDELDDREIRIGKRLDMQDLLAREVDARWERVGVVVSGPGPMCDQARAAVVAAAKVGKTQFELDVEAYSW